MAQGKFHIDIHGKPAPCKAKQNCPRGGDSEHFPSEEDAQKYADKVNEEKMLKTSLYEEYETEDYSVKKKENEVIVEDDYGTFIKTSNGNTHTVKYSNWGTEKEFTFSTKNYDRDLHSKLSSISYNDYGDYQTDKIQDMNKLREVVGEEEWKKIEEAIPRVNTLDPDYDESLMLLSPKETHNISYRLLETENSGADYLIEENDNDTAYAIVANNLKSTNPGDYYISDKGYSFAFIE